MTGPLDGDTLTAAIEEMHKFIAEEVGFDGGQQMRMQAEQAVERLAPIIAAAVVAATREAIADKIEDDDYFEENMGGYDRDDWTHYFAGLARSFSPEATND